MTFKQLADDIVKTRKEHGFITDWTNVPSKLMLIVTELSEAMESYRDADPEGFAEELADVMIRLLDLAYSLDIDLEERVKIKMEVNKRRPHLHGKHFNDKFWTGEVKREWLALLMKKDE